MSPQERIDSFLKDCGTADWDGYGAEPVTKAHIDQAKSFLELLPKDLVDKCDPGPIPDGGIALEWSNRTGEVGGKLFSIDCDLSGRLPAAWFFSDTEKGHCVFENWSDPKIVELIRKVYE